MNARQQQIVRTLLEALPYIRRFSGATVVVACEGAALHSDGLRRWLAEDLALLRLVGMKPVLVHDEISTPAAEAMVALVRWHGAPAVPVVDLPTAALERLIEGAVLDVPVSGGGPWAGDACGVAGELAAAVAAEKLIFLADVEGVHDNDPTEQGVVSECDLDELGRLQAAGAVDDDMLPKILAIRGALEAGVASAHVIDGRVEHALLLEILTDAGCGTKVTRRKSPEGRCNAYGVGVA